MGVVHGVKAFVPLLKTHGEGGHIVNTASMAGFLSGTGFGAYTASKFAVVGISEALATELEPHGIGVSILCPGWVATCISESRRNWPKEYGAPPPKGPLSEQFAELIRNGMAPSDVAELVLKGIEDNELYIFTHPEMRPWLEKRVDRCLVSQARPRAAGDNGMTFGIFYEHQIPRPWDTDAEHRIYREALEQVELADHVGIDYAWEVEHHFLEE